ncbi:MULTISPECIES: hypothetical protein [unclassified Fusibacter]|uniref:hypothetical protein n=1 Tax=unclassified Fusibacter TaxID=2624464 RepID=UPI001011AE4F|nr:MULTISPECIES: hypothetical protein [unclassified Fusibacter]MCK8059447.1 hypothetical protein [Fusibacter sp. A2]NPE21089.1 hypothetical protein [Fusibacter sp. A1]RXV62361.1 hypothetical protein DWB64_04585 [Fusibacter sp. A1]
MKVYALVGSSGTGKSHRALFVARQHDIHYIIDDGLLIKHNKKIAGKSAKREQTYIAAVKRAIFHHDSHLQEVKAALDLHNPKKLLIIGTSDAMVEKIARRLGIGEISETVYIDDISTPEEIQTARDMRSKHGKHVIPVPSVELKSDFSGYFLDKLKVFSFKRETGLEMAEKSVVRPTFSYLGKYTISTKALTQIAGYYLDRSEVVHSVVKLKFNEKPEGVIIHVEIIGGLGSKLHVGINKLIIALKDGLEAMTQLHVIRIEVYVRQVKRIKN